MWFRRRFNLPPNDTRYLALTDEEIETEYWAHRYADNPVTDAAEDDDFDLDEILAQAGDDDWEEVDLDHASKNSHRG